MVTKKKMNPRKLLVASVGIATLNYTLATGCDSSLTLEPILPGGGAGGMFNTAGGTMTGSAQAGSTAVAGGTGIPGVAGSGGVGGFFGGGAGGAPFGGGAGAGGMNNVGGETSGGETSDAGPSDASTPEDDASVDGG